MYSQLFKSAGWKVYKDQDHTPLEVGLEIGRGQFVVKRAWKRSPDKGNADAPFAQKSLHFGHDDNKAVIEEFLKEVKILRQAEHYHVVKFVDAYALESTKEVALVMDRASTNLDTYLKWGHPQVERQWYSCLVAAVDHIHGLGIRHRDIKPANILLHDGRVLLADFGISRMGIGITLSTSVPGESRPRTKEYCAPEVEEGSSRGRPADIFSLGAVFLRMIAAESTNMAWTRGLNEALRAKSGHSFAIKLNEVHKFMDGLQNPENESCALDDWQKKIVSLCQRMLQDDRDERPESRELLEELSPTTNPGHEGYCDCTRKDLLTDNARLLEACKEGSLEEAEELIRNGAHPGGVGPIHQASARGHKQVVQMLLEIDANIINLRDHSGQTALLCAAGYGHEAVINLLLERGTHSMSVDVEGRTALHYAAGSGHAGIVDLLMKGDEERTITELRDKNKQMALHFAAKRGHENVVRKLLSATTAKDVEDKDGRTPLHFASGFGSLAVVKMLLIDGEDYNAQDKNRSTALHFASQRKKSGGAYQEVIKELVDAGTDLDLPDTEGHRAIWYLRDFQTDPCYKILSAAMLKTQQPEIPAVAGK